MQVAPPVAGSPKHWWVLRRQHLAAAGTIPIVAGSGPIISLPAWIFNGMLALGVIPFPRPRAMPGRRTGAAEPRTAP
ncbi:hypothetical protein J2T21_003947 [Paeniglutamicibacter psychrophenolicus]|nr:hypothetical protein [Paeniglutamicibacter psychrophenolicus]